MSTNLVGESTTKHAAVAMCIAAGNNFCKICQTQLSTVLIQRATQ